MPARVDIAGERGARPAGLLGVRELRPAVVAAAFLVAVLIGVSIGYATADRGAGSGATGTATATSAPELSPAMRAPFWSTSRHPGQAHQVRVTDELDPVVLRLALQWTVANQIKAAGGDGSITARQVTVLDGMYFGAIEGVDAAQDEFWSVGRIMVSGTTAPPDPHVWRRVGTSPWTIVANGQGACDKIPAPLLQVWKGQPPPCIG
ncbi:hypothetical protein ND748_05460 [Frankia sp. AiPs1]|uniref:hypothetical protein n=1 Tax=Frankia sp. AiPs1 TaxID=573493 RepID=UPI002042D84F|nr:hypothetical protein [Frankia sp. AiPs1]MCM3921125.1 hypothetical protein [Frankia sp. AiPs1]